MLRGNALGMFERQISTEGVLDAPHAKIYGLTKGKLSALPLVEQLSWNWAILNENALKDLSDFSNVRLLQYEKFAHDPLTHTKGLFDFSGLPWDQQTEKFIHRSQTGRHGGYYSVYRGPDEAVNRWHTQLTEDQQKRIMAIVATTSLASLEWA